MLYKYKNALLSFVFLVLTFVLMYIVEVGSISLKVTDIFLVIIPIADIFAVFFALRSRKIKESAWVGDWLALIGLLTLLFIIFMVMFLSGWSQTTG